MMQNFVDAGHVVFVFAEFHICICRISYLYLLLRIGDDAEFCRCWTCCICTCKFCICICRISYLYLLLRIGDDA